ELLVGVVEVVRIGGLARGHLPQAAADQLGAELVADARPSRTEPGWPLAFFELGLVDVRHAATLRGVGQLVATRRSSAARRSASARMSMATMRSPAISNAMTEKG